LRFTVLADFDTQDLQAAARNVSLVQKIAKESLVLVEDPADLFLVHELRRLGVKVKAACLGHRKERLVRGAAGRIGVN
jgi:hypothetical protein